MRQNSDAYIHERIAEFKRDPEKYREANEFIDLLLQQALLEAGKRQKGADQSNFIDEDSTDFNNIKRGLGRARGFVIRMFDALCNCTQTAATAARSHVRNHPFSKR